VGPFVLLGNALGHPYGLRRRDSTCSVIYEEDPLLCFISVQDWSPGEDCNEEEVGKAVWGHVKWEMRTTRGSYKNRLTGYSETSEYTFMRATETAPEPLGEVK
jgi:hypothetical protein